ncbi:hypothetical protein Trco_008498 [Trichoderma cornu-damae]|uniref:Uncharacterized protein n=1 Tax=Trichoderma cornu-damae TaxID=654480 RepID=A0A9P8QIS9_9HYPO|nr:hypothetical protein Trco_008498 [Trichoderma cornu-damae]
MHYKRYGALILLTSPEVQVMPHNVRVAPSVWRAVQQIGNRESIDDSARAVTEFRQENLSLVVSARLVVTGHGKSSVVHWHLTSTEVGDGNGPQRLVDCAIG